MSKTEFSPTETAVRSVLKKYRKEIWAPFISAIKEYRLIEEGDVIGVCISGGKDSALLAVLMKQLQRYSDVPFRCEYICMDPGYSPTTDAGSKKTWPHWRFRCIFLRQTSSG